LIPRSKLRQYRDSTGFTLIELAIVMFIVTLLLGGMLLPLSAQQDVRNLWRYAENPVRGARCAARLRHGQ
jgi:prepilin-type N-terminal cleavage/methylation domain-containing protein